MGYYHSKTVDYTFEETLQKVADELKNEGFGILTEIDVKATLKKKLDVDFKDYRILGACNPPIAYEALQKEDKLGIMLPCNIVVTLNNENKVEVAVVNPLVAMMSVENPELEATAKKVNEKLTRFLEKL